MPMQSVLAQGGCPRCGVSLVGSPNWMELRTEIEIDTPVAHLVFVTECSECNWTAEIYLGSER